MAQTMFERYGGFATVSKVVMGFYDKALDSDIIGVYFEDVDLRRLIDHQTKFVSAVMGGPASYSDDQLRVLHAHLDITEEAFNEMLQLFEETLEDFEFEREDLDYIVRYLSGRAPYIIADQAD
jgi:hemoglobin